MRIIAAILFFAVGLCGAELNGWMAIKICSPRYPTLGLQAMISGAVRLKLHIDADGRVKEVQTVAGNPLLAEAARENLKSWRFARITELSADHTAASDLEFVYEFKIRDKTAPNPDVDFVFDYPGRITVTASAPHWVP
jgi:TonB family protein